MKHPNSVGYLLQNLVIKCNDKNNNVKYKSLLNQQKKLTNGPIRSNFNTPNRQFIYVYTDKF